MKIILNNLQRQFYNWSKPRALDKELIQLNLANIYILPSKLGVVYGFIVLSLLTGAVNYQVSSVFLMVFLMTTLGLVAMLQTHRNLNGLSIRYINVESNYQGHQIKLTLVISAKLSNYFSIKCSVDKSTAITIDSISKYGEKITLLLPSTNRGVYPLPRIKIMTTYPFGLFISWSYLHFDRKYFVYPASLSPGFWPKTEEGNETNTTSFQVEGDNDLYDLQTVDNPWHQASRIAWKLAARGQGWYVKILKQPQGKSWLFKLSDIPGVSTEKALQAITFWVVEAEKSSHCYGIIIGDKETSVDSGVTHLEHCLKLLASY